MDRATPSEVFAPLHVDDGGEHTTHFSVIDAEGNRVAVTQTINGWFGSGFVVPGLDLLLNNEMDDFTIKPGEPNLYQLVGAGANIIAPGKRMLSSMTPTFLESPRGVAVLGTPGGSRIISMVLLAALAWADGADAARSSRCRATTTSTCRTGLARARRLRRRMAASLERAATCCRRAAGLYGNMNVVTWDSRTIASRRPRIPRGRRSRAGPTERGRRPPGCDACCADLRCLGPALGFRA
jgi:gamma-glutamyltranspeptidase / glutathione hydrolase